MFVSNTHLQLRLVSSIVYFSSSFIFLKLTEPIASTICFLIARISELINERSQLSAAINTRSDVINGNGICPFTSTECASIKSVIVKYKEEVATLSDQLNDVFHQIDVFTEEREHSKIQLSECDKLMKSVESKYAEYKARTTQLNSLPSVTDSDVEIDFIDSAIESISDKLIKVQANERYNSLINDLTRQKYTIEQSIIALKAWITLTDANGLQTTMMEAPFKAFASELNRYIPALFSNDDVSAKFHMSTKANSFTFGVMRSDKYIPFDLLSSGEKCLYTLALMMCIVKHAKSPLKLIMIDDMLDHLDDTNICNLFESLDNIEDIQFVFAGVKPCISNNASDIVIEVS